MEITPDFASVPIEISEESSSAEAIRRSHIRAESDLKTAGTLILIFAVLGAFNYARSAEPMSANLTDLWMLIAFGITGVLLRGLHALGRWLYAALTIVDAVMIALALPALMDQIASGDTLFGLFLFTLILVGFMGVMRLVFLYVMWNRNARTVASKHYRDIIVPATPHIESSSSSWLVAAVFGPIALMVVGIILFAIVVM